MIDDQFEATLKALSDRGVNFVVIGGYAATLHGSACPQPEGSLAR